MSGFQMVVTIQKPDILVPFSNVLCPQMSKFHSKTGLFCWDFEWQLKTGSINNRTRLEHSKTRLVSIQMPTVSNSQGRGIPKPDTGIRQVLNAWNPNKFVLSNIQGQRDSKKDIASRLKDYLCKLNFVFVEWRQNRTIVSDAEHFRHNFTFQFKHLQKAVDHSNTR